MIRNKTRGFSIIEIIVVIAVVGMIVFAGWYAYMQYGKSSAVGSTMGQPQIPAKGAYLGAWINPTNPPKIGKTVPGWQEIQQLSAFNSIIGSSVAVLHVYTPFKAPLPVTTLAAINKNGSIPLIDWSCGNVSQISSGADDTIITTYAKSIKVYAKPVFLRWYWEMNIPDSFNSQCDGYGNGSAYIKAWQHIWNIFHSVNVPNVAFVWSPSVQKDAAQYYPGDTYVDWVGVDGYDRKGQGQSAFSNVFSSFYRQWSVHTKPIIIAETAAMATDQQAYLQGIQADLPSKFPDIKAIVYFDATGSAGNWSLTGNGVTAFKSLAEASYFITSVK